MCERGCPSPLCYQKWSLPYLCPTDVLKVVHYISYVCRQATGWHSVILFTHAVMHSPSRSRHPPRAETPQEHNPRSRHSPPPPPPGADTPHPSPPPSRWLLLRTVRILLECILVVFSFTGLVSEWHLTPQLFLQHQSIPVQFRIFKKIWAMNNGFLFFFLCRQNPRICLLAVADPGFSPRWGGANIWFCQKFPNTVCFSI